MGTVTLQSARAVHTTASHVMIRAFVYLAVQLGITGSWILTQKDVFLFKVTMKVYLRLVRNAHQVVNPANPLLFALLV